MDTLQTLSDTRILEDLQSLCGRENELTCQVLMYLIEADNRKLYLDKGYSSLFDYCTRALLYSEPAAMRRITGARCSRDYPEVYELLKGRKLTLSSISVFHGILTRDNVQEVLREVAGKSKREVERYVSRFNPVKKTVQRIRPVSVALPKEETSSEVTFSGGCDNPVQESLLESTPVEEHFQLSFSIPAPVMEKLKTAQALSSKGHRLSELFEALLDSFIESKFPKSNSSTKVTSQHSRYIPKATRQEVFARDEHRCAYVAEDGTRCSQTIALQLDHIEPFARGGGRDPHELRCLCAAHNRLMAEKEFGKEFMERFYS
jgi:5-methylcytosine-specific restriction endonuclease McrA